MAFFEQLGKHLTDAGQNVTQQTKNLAEITRLNSTISEKEKKISELYLKAGQSFYERHKSDTSATEQTIRLLIRKLLNPKMKGRILCFVEKVVKNLITVSWRKTNLCLK